MQRCRLCQFLWKTCEKSMHISLLLGHLLVKYAHLSKKKYKKRCQIQKKTTLFTFLPLKHIGCRYSISFRLLGFQVICNIMTLLIILWHQLLALGHWTQVIVDSIKTLFIKHEVNETPHLREAWDLCPRGQGVTKWRSVDLTSSFNQREVAPGTPLTISEHENGYGGPHWKNPEVWAL